MEMTFEAWMERVDNAVGVLTGLSADDLPDVDYYSMYQEGVKPIRAATRAVKNAQE